MVGVGAKKLNDTFGQGIGDPEVGSPVEAYVTYQLGQAIENWVKETFPTNPEYQEEFITSVLPSGAGSMLAIFLGGVGSYGANAARNTLPRLIHNTTKPAYVEATKQLARSVSSGSMATAGAMMGVPEYEAAKEAGLSDEKAFEVFLKNYLIGQTDAIPIGIALNRINKYTGNGVVRWLKGRTEGGVREMVQESVQGYLTNLTAREYYDEFRGLYDNIAA